MKSNKLLMISLLNWVILKDIEITKDGAIVLAQGSSIIHFLDLVNNEIGTEGLEALRHSTSVKHFDANGAWIK